VIEQRQTGEDNTVKVINRDGRGGVLLVCEHASNHIPKRYDWLGIEPKWRDSHAAWDPGALDVAKQLSRELDAPLVHGCVSRLVYDCNRAPDSSTAITEQSETLHVPGNHALSDAQRQERIDSVYRPFREEVERMIKRSPTALVSVHSFTAIYHGIRRHTDIGILHNQDSRLANLMLENISAADGRLVERNKPYGPQDDVMHSLSIYGDANDLPNVMIEIRSDLISDEEGVSKITGEILEMLVPALQSICEPHHQRRLHA